MAYCPRCGVQVECDVRKCPLCDFPIPDTGEVCNPDDQKYPQAINTYPEDHQEKKNKAFFSIGIIALCLLMIIMVIYAVYPWLGFIKYLGLSIITIFALVFFAMGYLKAWKNFLGAYLTLLLCGYFVYWMIASQFNWYMAFFFPILTLFYLDICLFRQVLKHTRNKSQFIFIPTSLILFLIILSMGIDGILSLHFLGHVRLTWSLIVGISGVVIILILQVIYHRLSEKTLEKLKKKMHV
jgi:uncharacterized membrane protein (DUF485 family)